MADNPYGSLTGSYGDLSGASHLAPTATSFSPFAFSPEEKSKTQQPKTQPQAKAPTQTQAQPTTSQSAPASSDGIPLPPKLELAPPPTIQPTSPTQQWGSLAMLFAGLGSLLTRGHATAALNAAAEVLKGFHQGDMEAANAAFESWKVSNDNLSKMANYEAQMYKATASDMFHKDQLSLEQQRNDTAALSATAKANHDVVMEHLAEQRNTIAIKNYVDGLQKKAADLQVSQEKAEQAMRIRNGLEDFKKNNPNATDADIAIEAHRLTSGQGFTSDEVDTIAEALVSHKYPVSSYTLTRPYMAAVVARAKQLDPNFDASTYSVQMAMQKALTSGQLGTKVTNARTTENHLKTMEQLADALPAGSDSRAMNTVVNSISRQFSNPALTNFQAAKDFVSNEIASAIAASGNLSVGERASIKDLFDEAQSPEALHGAIDTVKKFMAGRLDSVSDQIRMSGLDPSKYGITPDMVQFYGSPSQQTAAVKPTPSANQVKVYISNALSAIQKHAPADAVAQRLRDLGVPESEIQAAGIGAPSSLTIHPGP